MMAIRLISTNDKDMANGMRDTSKTPLTESEIEYVKSEIQRIGADLRVFVFNDKEHLSLSTCYNFMEDKIYVTRNVFPDEKYGSTHPRDLTSNCKNSPPSVGGEMNCNKNEKEHLFYCGKCVIIISVDNRKKADI